VREEEMAVTKEDIIKMPQWQKGLILLGCILLVGVLWYYLFYSPTKEEIPTLQGKLRKLDSDIQLQEKAKRTKRDLQTQIKEIQRELTVLRSQLPEEKEIPALLSGVTEVGRLNGLDFALFKQMPAVRKDYYSEIPIQITVNGRFHQVVQFLAKVGSMDRILQVSGLKMGKYKALNGGSSIESSLKATTYKYESTPLPKKPTRGRKR
jgi:type IV pilus assembly protein PilO